MKLSVKKKYIGGFATLLTFSTVYFFAQSLMAWLSQQSLSILILPSLFLVSLIYTINFWINLRDKDRIASDVSNEVSDGNLTKAFQIKEHLLRRSWEEAYTLNILRGKIKLTSSWGEQDKIDKLSSNVSTSGVIKEESRR